MDLVTLIGLSYTDYSIPCADEQLGNAKANTVLEFVQPCPFFVLKAKAKAPRGRPGRWLYRLLAR